jgi:protein-S-isoprenylcysteine O-methyltransferase Ste14
VRRLGRTAVPLLIMAGAPLTALLVWYTNVALDGSLTALAREIARHGLAGTALPVRFVHALPWFYLAFLAAVLVERALGDDARCAAKYGAAWSEYRQRVPYRIVPGLF